MSINNRPEPLANVESGQFFELKEAQVNIEGMKETIEEIVRLKIEVDRLTDENNRLTDENNRLKKQLKEKIERKVQL